MANSVSIASSVQVPNTVQAYASSSPLGQSASTNTSSAATTATTTSATHNPRLIDDPSVGLITEYYSANGGQIVTQTPSAAAVAYLRLGLTAEGLTKTEANQSGTVSA